MIYTVHTVDAAPAAMNSAPGPTVLAGCCRRIDAQPPVRTTSA